MNYRLSIILSLVVFLCIAGASWAAGETPNQLTADGITVSYPAGMESQAKRMMEIAKASILPSISINKQIVSLLSNSDSMSKDIANLLGYPEKSGKVKVSLDAYKEKSAAMVACFSNIKMIKKTDAASTGGVDAGIITVRYDLEKDEFNMAMNMDDMGPDKVKLSFFPVFLNPDGSIRAEKKLGEMAVDFMGSAKTMIIAPVHETVASIVARDLNLYYPFARWFNEGVSAWIVRQEIVKTDPKLTSLASDLFAVNATTKTYRDKINLLSWVQPAYQNVQSSEYDTGYETACVRYSLELITDLLGKNGSQTLPKIMKEVNFSQNADTDALLAAIKKTTGRDLKPSFMTYVPQAVRDGIASNEAPKLLKKAESLVTEKKWAEAAAKIRQALEMTPTDVNPRLNLSWIVRMLDQRRESELQVFLAARLITDGKHSVHLYGESMEGNYILARFSILMGNLDYAKKFLEPILQANPNHADAKRAMGEIQALEASLTKPQSN